MTILTEEHAIPVVRACQIARCSRTAWCRAQAADAEVLQAAEDAPVMTALQAVVEQHGRWGCWKGFDRLRALGQRWNHKRDYRVYRALGLNQMRRTKKRQPKRDVVPLNAPAQLNDTWAMDCMGDTLYGGRTDRVLNVIDEGNRDALAIEIHVWLPRERVVTVLDQLVALHGAPRRLRSDNGPEFIAEALRASSATYGVAPAFIEPGTPNQNTYIERFNRRLRYEVLDARVFTSVAEVRAVSEEWRHCYNTERAHDSLSSVPLLTFLPRPTSDPSLICDCALDGGSYGRFSQELALHV